MLLSSLLLSPMAASVALHALAGTPSLIDGTLPTAQPEAAPAPRRDNDEEALRGVRVLKPLALRLEIHPDTVALVLPSQTVLLVPDSAPLARPLRDSFLPDAPPSCGLSSRAPPS